MDIYAINKAVHDLTAVIDTKVQTRLVDIMARIAACGKEARFDAPGKGPGVKMFAGDVDPFIPGALMNMAALLTPSLSTECLSRDQVTSILNLVVREPQKSWGILFAIRGLIALHKADLLHILPGSDTLDFLRDSLTPDGFMEPDSLKLTERTPSNFYGVALGIRLGRIALGWDDPCEEQRLLNRIARLFAHHDSHIADETEGGGRFDRYSFFLPFDLAGHYMIADLPVPDQIKAHIRPVLPVLMRRLHPDGTGIEYGRSIGPHGEVQLAHGMAIAASCGLLEKEQLHPAAMHGAAVARRFAEFWWNAKIGSVDMWEGGRTTDRYRGPHRMLSENIGLGTNLLRLGKMWRDFAASLPLAPASETQPSGAPDQTTAKPQPCIQGHVQRFTTRGKQPEYALVTVNDAAGYWGLPFVNGGHGNHRRSDYLPIPYRHGIVAGAPMYGKFPQLVPQLELQDGSAAMPTVFFQNITHRAEATQEIVQYSVPYLCKDADGTPEKEPRWTAETTFVFRPGHVHRHDTFRRLDNDPKAELTRVSMIFASLAQTRDIADPRQIQYEPGDLISFKTSGFTSVCPVDHAGKKSFRTPTGAYLSVLEFSGIPQQAEFRCSWDIVHRLT